MREPSEADAAAVEGDADEAERYRLLLGELFGARRAGVVLGLERMHQILGALGHPERRLGAIVHVAGTNGKGSTVAMIAAMARAHGARVAQYTSPHLATVRERISDDDGWISRAEFLAAADEVWAAGGRGLTFFEQLTAIGLVALAARRPEVTVLEVGLGGRLDATNVVDSAVAVVTGIALDHQGMLGDTLELIAVEKAGIFRSGTPAIIGASGEASAVAELVRCAVAAGAHPVRVIGEAEVAALAGIALGLAGAHQRRNAAAAVAAIEALVARGVLRDDAAARRRGLWAARHPGRFERIAEAPAIVVDGAHNPHGAAALAAAIEELGEEAGEEIGAGAGEETSAGMIGLPRPRVLVLAVSSDKDVAGIAAPLWPHFDAVIATAYRQERAMAAGALVEALGTLGAGEAEHRPGLHQAAEVEAALALARQLAGPGGSIVVAGSLFVVGEARVAVLGGEVDPLRLSDPSGPPKP